jgi:drug/metabolite transporter (DMT)-like permease
MNFPVKITMQDKRPLFYAIAAAVLFGLTSPFSKLLLDDISPIALAGLLYLGGGLGLSLYLLVTYKVIKPEKKAASLEKRDWPWVLGATLAGGIAGPILMMLGLNLISGFATSLLLNLEGLCTTIIAIVIFRENAGRNLWLALLCMLAAGVLLSWDTSHSKFNILGPLLLVLATFCWGIDNNLTRQISEKNPAQIAAAKGLIAGTVSFSLALILKGKISFNISILYALLLGAFSYGISLVLFITALKGLGSSRTALFLSMGSFVGAVLSLIIFKNWNEWTFLPAFVLMAVGIWFIYHERHFHAHAHGLLTHTHTHRHDDLHHQHEHTEPVTGSHSHEHTHTPLTHTHVHWPDTHHRHAH